ncbi:MAG: hypothetical protein KGO51_13150 [Alphaproteobacteria bacterium]|nr:hypothetical protein [Alphaproteobacteria bacterium]
MRSLGEIQALIEDQPRGDGPAARAREFLAAGEEVLEHWLSAHERQPTQALSEGFRLLALHRQAAKGDPSFNACRETCRELVYHHNLIVAAPQDETAARHALTMRFVLNHLYLFVSGKMEVAGLGEFCCASRPLRTQSA